MKIKKTCKENNHIKQEKKIDSKHRITKKCDSQYGSFHHSARTLPQILLSQVLQAVESFQESLRTSCLQALQLASHHDLTINKNNNERVIEINTLKGTNNNKN